VGSATAPFFLMKILLNKSILIKGEHFAAGEVHEVEETEAQKLITGGRAIEANEAPACPPTAKPKAKKVKSILEEVKDGAE